MPLEIVRDDLTKMHVDAIVNATDEELSGGGGLDAAIHRAGGEELTRAVRAIGSCRTGGIAVTPGFGLPCRYVLHAVGPVYLDGAHREAETLASCYDRALEFAGEHGLSSIAFPLIASNMRGFPREQVLSIATDRIRSYLRSHDLSVYLVLYDRESFSIGQRRFREITAYIDDHYVDERAEFEGNLSLRRERSRMLRTEAPDSAGPAPRQASRRKGLTGWLRGVELPGKARKEDHPMPPEAPAPAAEPSAPPCRKLGAHPDSEPFFSRDAEDSGEESLFSPEGAAYPPQGSSQPVYPSCGADRDAELQNMLRHLDAGFSNTLLRLIDEKGITDVECYKRANISRKLFSKIRSDPEYRPSKNTVLAFAIALELRLDAATDLLARAGYALSPASKSDLIVRYFIERRQYDIFEVNEALFAIDQSLLGAS